MNLPEILFYKEDVYVTYIFVKENYLDSDCITLYSLSDSKKMKEFTYLNEKEISGKEKLETIGKCYLKYEVRMYLNEDDNDDYIIKKIKEKRRIF